MAGGGRPDSGIARYARSVLLLAGGERPGLDWRSAAAMALAFPGVDDPAIIDEKVFAAQLLETHNDILPLLVEQTGLSPRAPIPGPVVLSRAEWLTVMFEELAELMEPVLGELLGGDPQNQRSGPGGRLGSGIISVEMATVMGYVSRKVLGQYDWPLSAASPRAGAVYFLQNNIESVARRHRLHERELLVWLVAHELTHALQFSSVPWLGEYFRGLIGAHLARLRDIAGKQRSLGMSAVVLLDRLLSGKGDDLTARTQSLMACVEGYADFAMKKVAGMITPDSTRLASLLLRHEASRSWGERLIDKLVGLETKMGQYRAGRHFFEEVYLAGGPNLAVRVWESREHLPDAGELADPASWVRRVGR